ncbi:MAG TPA: putative sulfate exporter family transporter, partial [Edaphobacter sp.]|nr:putative sulfate exporter family transporter [Edaphobacter sp.]
FGMNLGEVVHAGHSGVVYTAVGITFALSLGIALGKLLHVGKTQSLLISVGTAICGGSAIAAMGPVLEAGEEEMAVSLGTVFVPTRSHYSSSLSWMGAAPYPDSVR